MSMSKIFVDTFRVIGKGLGILMNGFLKVTSVVFKTIRNVKNGFEWVVEKTMTITGKAGKFFFKTVYLASCTGKMLLALFPYDVMESETLTMLTNPAKGTYATVIIVAGTAYVIYE